jgi:zeaxanthin glucosyltransferase
MTHFGIIAPPLRGHLDPFAALAEALRARGHAVTAFIDRSAAALLRGKLSVCPLDLPAAGALEPHLPSAGGGGGLAATVRAMAQRTRALCAVLPHALGEAGVEAVLADQTEAAGGLVARHLALPYASIACALPLNREDDVPPPYVGWHYGSTPWHRWLYRGGYRVVDWLMTPLTRTVQRQAAAWSLSGITRLEDTFSPDLQLLQLPRALDFPRHALSPAARYLGPFRAALLERWDLPDDDGRPLAFCSLGTLQGGRAPLFAVFARVLADAGLRPVIAHGGRLAPALTWHFPGRPIVADFLPQRAVLARARIAIVHGGLNTVLDALSLGVPMILVPLAFEQGAIAARVAASGAGIIVPARRVGRDLRGACARLLGDPAYAARARVLQRAIAESGGAATAAVLVEQLSAAGP